MMLQHLKVMYTIHPIPCDATLEKIKAGLETLKGSNIGDTIGADSFYKFLTTPTTKKQFPVSISIGYPSVMESLFTHISTQLTDGRLTPAQGVTILNQVTIELDINILLYTFIATILETRNPAAVDTTVLLNSLKVILPIMENLTETQNTSLMTNMLFSGDFDGEFDKKIILPHTNIILDNVILITFSLYFIETTDIIMPPLNFINKNIKDPKNISQIMFAGASSRSAFAALNALLDAGISNEATDLLQKIFDKSTTSIDTALVQSVNSRDASVNTLGTAIGSAIKDKTTTIGSSIAVMLPTNTNSAVDYALKISEFRNSIDNLKITSLVLGIFVAISLIMIVVLILKLTKYF